MLDRLDADGIVVDVERARRLARRRAHAPGELREVVGRMQDVERHLRFTGSTLALSLLDHWDSARTRFVKVFPNEYKRALTEMYLAEEKTIPAVPEKKQKAAA